LASTATHCARTALPASTVFASVSISKHEIKVSELRLHPQPEMVRPCRAHIASTARRAARLAAPTSGGIGLAHVLLRRRSLKQSLAGVTEPDQLPVGARWRTDPVGTISHPGAEPCLRPMCEFQHQMLWAGITAGTGNQ